MSYIQRLRAKIGQDKFIHPAARIIIENDNKQILIVERKDNGNIGLPAGALEEGETIEACIAREVMEETGLQVHTMELIGISSDPQIETVVYPNRDIIQYFTIEFFTKNWSGSIAINDPAEIKTAKFVEKEYLSRLPKNEYSAIESLDYFLQTGKPYIK